MKVALRWLANDYACGLMLAAMRTVFGHVELVTERTAQIILIGPYHHPSRLDRFRRWGENRSAIRVFHSGENTRYNLFDSDFQFTSDLLAPKTTHFRLPFWWEGIDWCEQGVTGVESPRFGRLIQLSELMSRREPRNDFNDRCAFFTSHLREPRKSLMEFTRRHLAITGYGPAFDANIRNHNTSGLVKETVLKEFGFSFCPENSLSPGYYTEKVVEAYAAGTIPLAWCDSNVHVDFNPQAFINLNDYLLVPETLSDLLANRDHLAAIYSSPLILNRPDFDGFLERLREIGRCAS
jgi:hypothetical protein